MGQQQLLLIVLGIIVVALAVVVGINIFNANSVDSNRNSVIADLHHLDYLAQAYFKRSTNFNGGGNSFAGFAIPTDVASTVNGTYTISTPGTATTVSITGVGKELGDNGTSGVSYQMTITANAVPTVTKLN